MVHTTVLTEQPRSGIAVKAQVWVTATGAPANNVTLLLDAGADTTLTPQCTLAQAAGTTCRLGTLDAQGVTIPLTLQTPLSTTARTITLTATAAAAPAFPAQLNTAIALSPAAVIPAPKPTKTSPSPKPTKTTHSPKPVKTTPVPQPTTSPAAPVTPPPVPATVPAVQNPAPYTPDPSTPAVILSSTPALPQIAPDPANTFPTENIIITPPSSPPASPLSLTPVSSTLTAAHSLWLGALLTAIITTLLIARRRSRRPALISSRRKTESRSGHRRYTPQGTHSFAHGEPTELPATSSEHPPRPMKAGVNAKDAEEIEAARESLQYFEVISVAFNKTETSDLAQTRADWHGVPIEVETIGAPRHPRAEPVTAHAVQARSLSWIRALITKRGAASNNSREPASETLGPDGSLGPSQA